MACLASLCAFSGAFASAVAPARAALPRQGSKLTGGAEESGAGNFGASVALAADGGTAIVGAPHDAGLAGAAWPFTGAGGAWAHQGGKLAAAAISEEACPSEGAGEESDGCGLGAGVALSANGDTALVGSPREQGQIGAVRVFVREGSTWSEQAKLTGGEEETTAGRFGRSVVLSADGNTALVGAPGDRGLRGAAWVFRREGVKWVQDGPKLDEPAEGHESLFGTSVALSHDGRTALIGAPGDHAYVGAAFMFTRGAQSWTQVGGPLTGETTDHGRFGRSVALSASADRALVGAPRESGSCAAEPQRTCPGLGAAWVFRRVGGGWLQEAKLFATGESGPGEFGFAVALSADAAKALVGAPNDRGRIGSAFLLARAGESWAQTGQLAARGEEGRGAFGRGVALSADGETALVGAPHERGSCAGEIEPCTGVGGAWPFAPGAGGQEVEEEEGSRRKKEPPGGPGTPLGGGAGSGSGDALAGGVGVLGFGALAHSGCSVSLASRGIPVKGRRATIKLLARGTGVCSGTLRLAFTRRISRRRHSTKTIARARFSIAPGGVRTLRLSLNSIGRALLSAGHGRLGAVLVLVKLSPFPIEAQNARVRLAMAPAARKHKHA